MIHRVHLLIIDRLGFDQLSEQEIRIVFEYQNINVDMLLKILRQTSHLRP